MKLILNNYDGFFKNIVMIEYENHTTCSIKLLWRQQGRIAYSLFYVWPRFQMRTNLPVPCW